MSLHRFAGRLTKLERAIASEYLILRLVDGGTKRLPAGAALSLSLTLMTGEALSSEQIDMLRLFVRSKPMPTEGALMEMLRREGPEFLRRRRQVSAGS